MITQSFLYKNLFILMTLSLMSACGFIHQYNIKACNTGNARKCYDLGRMYKKRKSYGKAAEFYRKACKIGYTSGCSRLGSMYAKGIGVDKNSTEALKLYRKACDGRDPNGCIALARIRSHDNLMAQIQKNLTTATKPVASKTKSVAVKTKKDNSATSTSHVKTHQKPKRNIHAKPKKYQLDPSIGLHIWLNRDSFPQKLWKMSQDEILKEIKNHLLIGSKYTSAPKIVYYENESLVKEKIPRYVNGAPSYFLSIAYKKYSITIKLISNMNLRHTYTATLESWEDVSEKLKQLKQVIEVEHYVAQLAQQTLHFKKSISFGMPLLTKNLAKYASRSQLKTKTAIKSAYRYEKKIYQKKPLKHFYFGSTSFSEGDVVPKHKIFINTYEVESPNEYGVTNQVNKKSVYTDITTRHRGNFIEKTDTHEIIYKKTTPHYGLVRNPFGFTVPLLASSGCIETKLGSGCYIKGKKVGMWKETLYHPDEVRDEEGEIVFDSFGYPISFSDSDNNGAYNAIIEYTDDKKVMKSIEYENANITTIDEDGVMLIQHHFEHWPLNQYVLRDVVKGHTLLVSVSERDDISYYQVALYNNKKNRLKKKSYRFCGYSFYEGRKTFIYNIIDLKLNKADSQKIKAYEITDTPFDGTLAIELYLALENWETDLKKVKRPHYYSDQYNNVIGMAEIGRSKGVLHGRYITRSMRSEYSSKAHYHYGKLKRYSKTNYPQSYANQKLSWICNELPYGSLLLHWDMLHKKASKSLMERGSSDLGYLYFKDIFFNAETKSFK